MRTIAEVERWVDSHPTRHQGGPWGGRCEQLVNNAGGFTQGFPDATHAAAASGPLDENWRTAKRGEIHYWSGGANNFGHVSFELGGGTQLMASYTVVGNGNAGRISFQNFTAQRGYLTYLGHTFRHGTERLAGYSLAAGTITPIVKPLDTPTPGRHHMRLLEKETTGTTFLDDDVKKTITKLPKEKVRSHTLWLGQPVMVSDDELDSYVDTYKQMREKPDAVELSVSASDLKAFAALVPTAQENADATADEFRDRLKS